MKIRGWLSAWVLLGILFFQGNLFAGSLDNWHWRNPLPTSNPQLGPLSFRGVLFTNGWFVAVGDDGEVTRSSDGTNWTQNPTATTSGLNSLIYVGGQYVAVGNGGAVETSVDTTNWVLQNSGITNPLLAVTYGNGKFVAVGNNNVITSPNAVNWTPAVSGLSAAIAVAGSGFGFVAVNGPDVYFSTDGSTWTSQVLTAPGFFLDGGTLYNWIVTYADGAFLVGSSHQSTLESVDDYMFRSVDGVTWTTNTWGNVSTGTWGFTYNFFMAANGQVVAGGIAATFPFFEFSADGINWNSTNAVPSTYNQGTSGAYGNGTYVVVVPPATGYLPPQILVSTDGVNWTNVEQPPTPPAGPAFNFTSLAFTNGIYVAGSSTSLARSTNGLVYNTVTNSPALTSVISYGGGFIGAGSAGNIYVSSDGLSWTQRTSATSSNLHDLTSGGGLLVAVGDGGAIQTSAAGTIWTIRTSGTSQPLYGITYSNGLFVAVGNEGTVLTSPDGINWAGQYSGQVGNLLSVSYGSAGFAAVGPGGTILTSPDAINWTAQVSGTTNTLESITFGNGYYLAVGNDATVLSSPDGATWTPRNIGATGGQNFYGAAFLTNRFDVVGSGGSILESDATVPLFAVQMICAAGKNAFTMFITPGSTFRLQYSATLSAGSWMDAATFANAAAITCWTNSTSATGQMFFRGISP